MRTIKLNDEIERICDFIKKYTKDNGFENVIVGLSGGIDSSLTATLAARALGKEHVIGIMMPYRTSHPFSLADAQKLAAFIDIKTEVIDISPMVDGYFQTYEKEADALRRGNYMARTRMCVLYDKSSQYKALVAGTSNKSEIMTGYSTQYGDSACAFEPIGHLYKTEVRGMAKILNIPAVIIEKPPTADLWADQTDEKELGLTYTRLDSILNAIMEQKMSEREIIGNGYTQSEIDRVKHLVKISAFKRRLPEAMEGVWSDS
ncbi:MAG TPA: NAD+ synthase [Candidatus Cloacimonadota bacterium]|nr:NAD+ synthase [Candidatus Cloacimonadota bacterium]HPT71771.1 NAD+ synthase [Candidatus Cloacimonadota bacterium]